MKPAPFDYVDPPDLEGVLTVLASRGDDAVVIGGGQSLVPLLNLRLARPEVVVDPRRVEGLDTVVVGHRTIEIGARVTASELIAHAGVAAAVPGLIEAARGIGHVQIRNRTTIGGSVAHADPAAELPTALVALDGSVVLRSRSSTRVVSAVDFFEGPFTTTRRPDELVTSVRIPVHRPAVSGWLEHARRPGDFALVGVCAVLRTDPSGVVSAAALALSGVGGRPERMIQAEALLVGRSPDDLTGDADGDLLDQVDRAVRDAVDPTDDIHASAAHRRALAGVLTTRLLARLARRPDGAP